MKTNEHYFEPHAPFCSCGQDTVTCQGCGKLICGSTATWITLKGNIGPCCIKLWNSKPPPKTTTHHARAGDQLAAHMGVRTLETTTGALFIYKERTIAIASKDEVRIEVTAKLPKRVARALGHFLVNNAREQR